MIYDSVKSSSFTIALVSTIKHAPDFSIWLHHYRSVLNIDLIFLQIDNNPVLFHWIQQLSLPNVFAFEHTTSNHHQNLFDDIQQVQRTFVNKVIEQCYQHNIRYLLHVDDDELLVVSKSYRYSIHRWIDSNKIILNQYTNIKFQNMEAIYPPDSYDCFQTSYFAPCHQLLCKGYVNGKSMASLHPSSPRVSCLGCHDFSGPSYSVPIEEVILLHFDNCSYESWKRKFSHYALSSNNDNIPFPFYRDSIEIIKQNSPVQPYLFWHDHHTKQNMSPYFDLEKNGFQLKDYYQ